MLLFFIFISFLALLFTVLLIIPLLIARFLLSLIFLVIAVPLIAVTAYWYLGGSALIQELLHRQQQDEQVQVQLKEFDNSPSRVIEVLTLSLKENPNRAQGWYLLGKLYLGQENYAEAAAALAEANRLEPKKVEYTLAYAEALFLLNHQSLNPKISQLLTMVLQVEPNNLDALNLFAMGAYNAKEYSVAIHYWRQILSLLPEGSPDQTVILNMMSKAEELEEKDKPQQTGVPKI